jgi:hypothetical protein
MLRLVGCAREVIMRVRHPRHVESVETLDFEHRIDREALVVQLRALGTAVERLADAVELLAAEDLPPAVAESLDEVRLQLKHIW